MESHPPRQWARRPPERLQPYPTWARMAGSHELQSGSFDEAWPNGLTDQNRGEMQTERAEEASLKMETFFGRLRTRSAWVEVEPSFAIHTGCRSDSVPGRDNTLK